MRNNPLTGEEDLICRSSQCLWFDADEVKDLSGFCIPIFTIKVLNERVSTLLQLSNCIVGYYSKSTVRNVFVPGAQKQSGPTCVEARKLQAGWSFVPTPPCRNQISFFLAFTAHSLLKYLAPGGCSINAVLKGTPTIFQKTFQGTPIRKRMVFDGHSVSMICFMFICHKTGRSVK